VLDTIGCMVGATRAPAGRRIIELTATRGGSGRTTTVGLAAPRRVEDTALANGTLAHMLEFDDGHRPSDNHLGCVVVPAALALAEETNASLGTCLEATLLPRNETCFHGTGTTGAFGAAAVAARLLELDALETAHSFAIAGTAAAGLRESMSNGPDCKPLHAGRATTNGVTSAYLAAGGYTGPLTIFEGVHGFCNAMCNNPRPQLILDGLGDRFSTCGMLFNVLDGVLDVRRRHKLDDAPPPQIRVGVPSWIVEDPPFTRRRPASGGEARFSIPFAVAAAIVDGEVSMRQMTVEKLADPTIAELEQRVQIDYDDEVEAIYQCTKGDSFFYYPAAIEFDQDGQTHRSLYTNPRGYDPTLPLSQEELVAKFHSTVEGILERAAADEVVEVVLGAPLDTPVTAIMQRLRLG
jgi:2-methylcitrate dehydratase PrpD